MAVEKGLVAKQNLTDIADAIRAKLESTETMAPGEMAALIESISAGAEIVTGTYKSAQYDNEVCVINHNLGRVPKYALMIMNYEGSKDRCVWAVYGDGTTNRIAIYDSQYVTWPSDSVLTMTDTRVTFRSDKLSMTAYFWSSYTYNYAIVG